MLEVKVTFEEKGKEHNLQVNRTDGLVKISLEDCYLVIESLSEELNDCSESWRLLTFDKSDYDEGYTNANYAQTCVWLAPRMTEQHIYAEESIKVDAHLRI